MKYLFIAVVCFSLVGWALCETDTVSVTFFRGQGCNDTSVASAATCTNFTQGTTTVNIINGNDAGWQFTTTINKNAGDSVLVQGSLGSIYVGEGMAEALLQHDAPAPQGGGDVGGNAGAPFYADLPDRPVGENATYIFTINCPKACGYAETLIPSLILVIATIFTALY